MTYIIELKKKVVVDATDAADAIEYAINSEKNLPVWKVKATEKQEER